MLPSTMPLPVSTKTSPLDRLPPVGDRFSPLRGEMSPQVTKWGADVANGGKKGNKVARRQP